MTNNATEPHGLETISKSGVAPEERLPSAARRRSLAALLIKNDGPRNKFDTRIKGMVDGNPPYTPSKLKKLAQSWRDNTNYGEGRSARDTAMVPYYDLLAGSKHYCNVRLKHPDRTLVQEKSEIATEQFDAMLRAWEPFEYNLMLAMNDRLLYGKGFMAWCERWGMDFKWVNRFNVHVPDRSEACVDYLEALVIEEDMPVDKLYRYAKASGAGERGWNVKECERAIRRAEAVKKNEDDRQDRQQQRLADKDLLEGQSSAAINAAHVFVREFNGKISHYIVELEGAASSVGPTSESRPDGDLFGKQDEYDSWRQCFWATFHEITDGSWNGASGLGRAIIKHIEIKNRLQCAATDLAFLRSSINVQASSEASFGKVAVIQQGPITVYPPGYTHLNVASFVGDIDSVLGLNEHLHRLIGRNTGIFQQVPEKTEGNPLTATGEMLRQQHTAVLTNSSVQRFYRDLDWLYSELYRRAVETPRSLRDDKLKEFFAMCEDRGLTEEELKDVDYVRAQRNSGNGSIMMRQQNLAALAPLVSSFPEKGRTEWVRDSASALTNFETASRYMPDGEVGEDITHHHQIAQLENDSLKNGSPVIFSPNDNHVIHAQVHLQNAGGALQGLEQGADPMQVLAGLEMLMPHCNMHVISLEQNPGRQNEAKMLREQWNQIAKMTDDLRKQVEQMQQDEAKRHEAELQAELIKRGMDPEIQLKAAAQEADIRLKKERQDAMLAMRKEKLDKDSALKDASVASQIELSTVRTASELEQSAAKTLQELQANAAKAAAASKPGAQQKQENPTINIAVKSDGGEQKKRGKKVSFERDNKGRIAAAKVEEE
jgi:hypothetical protein